MTIQCNVTGSERKRLAHTLGVITLCEPVYCYAPTFAYTVGDYTVDKDGTISCPDTAMRELLEQIVSQLAAEGFSPAVDEIIADDSNGDSDGESEPDEIGILAEEATSEMPAETPDVAPEPEAEAMRIWRPTWAQKRPTRRKILPRITLARRNLFRKKSSGWRNPLSRMRPN